MEISENSENHLKAIVGWAASGWRWMELVNEAENAVKKTQGEGKASKIGERGWQSGVGSANYIDLREMGELPSARSFGIGRSGRPTGAGTRYSRPFDKPRAVNSLL